MPKLITPAPVIAAIQPDNPLEKRLTELHAEFAAGQKMLTDLISKEDELKTTLIRISGAIQVLEELLAQDAPKEKENADLHSKK